MSAPRTFGRMERWFLGVAAAGWLLFGLAVALGDKTPSPPRERRAKPAETPTATEEPAPAPRAPTSAEAAAKEEEREAAIAVVDGYLTKKRVPHKMDWERAGIPGYISLIIITEACSQRLVDDVAHENGSALFDSKIYRVECRNASATKSAVYKIGR